MSSPTLLVLAAGLGSRYGAGIKQMDPVGPDGEFVLDYSVYDAWKAGFGKVVFIIREDLEDDLKAHFQDRLVGKVDVEYVVQDMKVLPGGVQCPGRRVKPWGTGHAIWSARNAINEPFAAINADDYYGSTSYELMAQFLSSPQCDPASYGMVGFELNKTLSANGTVSRGICEKTREGILASVIERKGIESIDGEIRCLTEDGHGFIPLTGRETASMNFWGFHPTIFRRLDRLFAEFWQRGCKDLKAEYYIPTVVDTLIQREEITVKVLETTDRWFGMTYAEDRAIVKERLKDLTALGMYPHRLWNNEN
ncbi:MAG: nucleotidyltransferase [Lentisphaerae bacterium]|jgi:UTP-glucose-1-phosphate uridylyltransferase|nr:nucleotidyltransferase [Lentisphaerota bacterium]